MKRKFIIALTIILCLVSSPVFADVKEDVKNAQIKYEEYQSKVDSMTGEIVKLNSSIEEKLVSIEDNNSKIDTLNSEIETSEKLISGLREDIKEREKIKKQRVREFYKNGGSIGYIGMFISFDNFWEFINKVENTNRLIKIDREIVLGIEKDKRELDNKIIKQEDDKSEVLKLNSKVKEDMKVLETKKSEQEELLHKMKSEQDSFGKDVLEVAERELIKPQISIIESSSDINSLSSAVSQLVSIRDNQLQMDSVKEEINNIISQANGKIESLRPSSQAVISNINRGPINSTGNAIVDYAYKFLGRSYVWGAVGPDVFDCSGLTSYVYRNAANLEISRTTYTQINVGTPVSQRDLQPGDLVFTFNNEHVGIYVGGGMYINATMPGDTVRVTPVTNFYAARRIL